MLTNFVLTNKDKFTVSGHFQLNKPGTLNIVLKEYNTLQNIQTALDTFSVSTSGNFREDFDYPPGIYQVDFEGIHKINIAVDSGQEVHIKLTIMENGEVRTGIDGSHDAQLVFDYDKQQQAAYKKWLHPVRREIRLAREAGQMDRIPALSEKEKKNLIAYKNELASYTRKNFGNSIALFYAAIRLDPELHMDYLRDIASLFNKERPELSLTRQFNNKIKRIQRTAVGSPAPQITFDGDSQQIRLSDYRGSYVLLDFWAAWCNPCRIENLNYRRLYQEYKEKGFEIFAVSIDTNETLWQRASLKDNISWTNISDLKGWATPSAGDYNITAIPANFLIDPRGTIIAKNIRGKELQDKLARLLN